MSGGDDGDDVYNGGERTEVMNDFLERHRLKFKERQRLMHLRQKIDAAIIIQVIH